MTAIILALLLTVSACAADVPTKRADVFLDAVRRGRLGSGDARFEKRGPFHVYGFTATESGEHTVDLESFDFDGFLRITDGLGKRVGENDDGGVEINARARFRAVEGREYRILAVANPGGSGDYFLSVRVGREERLSGEELRDAAIEFRESAADRAAARGDRVGAVRHRLLVGNLYSAAARYGPATEVLEEALKLADEMGNEKSKLLILKSLGFVDIGLGEGERSLSRFQAMLELARRQRNGFEESSALRGLVTSSLMLDKPDDARRHQLQHLHLARDSKRVRDIAESLLSLGRIHRRLADHDDARRVLDEALGKFLEEEDLDGQIRTLEAHAAVEEAAKDWKRARERLDDALSRARQLRIEIVIERVQGRIDHLERRPERDGVRERDEPRR